MSTSSVGVKQSWTSAMASSVRGSVMPAWAYASAAAAAHSGSVVKSNPGSTSPLPLPATSERAFTYNGASV